LEIEEETLAHRPLVEWQNDRLARDTLGVEWVVFFKRHEHIA
jgi:hypothetical protein